MFESTFALFDRYYAKLSKEKAPNFSCEHGREVRRRLRQLDHLLNLVRAAEARENQVSGRIFDAAERHSDYLLSHGLDPASVPPPEDTRLTFDEHRIIIESSFEMQLFAESFYYIAGRLRTALQSGRLPGLSNFECEGARDVRNELLGHPEGEDRQVVNRGFAWGKENGPALNAARYAGRENVFLDRGLYVNAEEIRANLEGRLRSVLGEAS